MPRQPEKAMKRICLFNDFQLPLPPVNGGSVPTLIDFILSENEKYKLYDIDVFSCYNEKALEASKKYRYSHFYFIKDAKAIKFITNLKFVLNNKFHCNFNLSEIPLPRSAKKIFLKNKYDLVYINGYIRGALSIMKLSQAPCVLHHHVVTDILNEPTIQGENLVTMARKIAFVSQFAANYAKTGTRQQNEKMCVLPNAIDLQKFVFRDRNAIRREIRQKIGIKNEDIVIIFVGRLVSNKGALELIKAFNMCEFNDSVKLMIVGGATWSSKKKTSYVKKCIDNCKTNTNIILTGYVNYSDIPKYYIASDIGTLISVYDEACGMVGIECMAAGLPVITTDRAGIPEYVSEDCKVVVHEGETLENEISNALKLLVSNAELRAKMGNAAIIQAQKFDKSTYYQNFSALVDEILK